MTWLFRLKDVKGAPFSPTLTVIFHFFIVFVVSSWSSLKKRRFSLPLSRVYCAVNVASPERPLSGVTEIRSGVIRSSRLFWSTSSLTKKEKVELAVLPANVAVNYT